MLDNLLQHSSSSTYHLCFFFSPLSPIHTIDTQGCPVSGDDMLKIKDIDEYVYDISVFDDHMEKAKNVKVYMY